VPWRGAARAPCRDAIDVYFLDTHSMSSLDGWVGAVSVEADTVQHELPGDDMVG
jgi:hypothetical protein